MKWYWWLLIAIVGLIILLSLIGSLIGATKPGSSISNGLLGLAGGILNMLEHDPFFQAFALIWAFPFLVSGASALVTAYRAHFCKEGSSFTEQNKEMKVDQDSIDKVLEKYKDIKDPVERIKRCLQDLNTELWTNTNKQVEALKIAYKGQAAEIARLNKIIEELNKALDELKNKDEISKDSKEIEPAKPEQ